MMSDSNLETKSEDITMCTADVINNPEVEEIWQVLNEKDWRQEEVVNEILSDIITESLTTRLNREQELIKKIETLPAVDVSNGTNEKEEIKEVIESNKQTSGLKKKLNVKAKVFNRTVLQVEKREVSKIEQENTLPLTKNLSGTKARKIFVPKEISIQQSDKQIALIEPEKCTINKEQQQIEDYNSPRSKVIEPIDNSINDELDSKSLKKPELK